MANEDTTQQQPPQITWVSSSKPRKVEWLWEHRIPIGKLTIISGDPDLGKSLVLLDWAARVSTGSPWPLEPPVRKKPGRVLLLCGEDDLDDTICPRLKEAGADESKIGMLEFKANGEGETVRSDIISLDRDLVKVDREIRLMGDCQMVVIDPLNAYLGKVDSHNDLEVRKALAPLVAIVQRRRAALLAVMHRRKSGGLAMEGNIGSIAFSAASRASWVVMADEDDPNKSRRTIQQGKHNLGPRMSGAAFRIVAPKGEPRVVWELEPIEASADESLRESRKGPKPEMQDAAAGWLMEVLDEGPIAVDELKKMAKEENFSWRTVERAKAEAGVKSMKGSGSPDGAWQWGLRARLPR